MHRWEDNITFFVKEIGWKGVDWVYLAQGPDSIKAGNLLSNKVTVNFLRRTLYLGISYSPQTRK
jgi:hypothetical protein